MAFELKWRPEILSDMLSVVLAETGITDVFPASALVSLLNAAATEDARINSQMQELIELFNLDTIEGQDLDDKAFELGLERFDPQLASGFVTIGDANVTKISSPLYPGTPGPLQGATSLNVSNASGFPASGVIIVGRGTSNVETVTYNAIVDFGAFQTLNLAAGLQNDHGTEETVIISQGGNRTVAAGTIVRVPETDNSDAIEYTVTQESIVLDGEAEVVNVPVQASLGGEDGNVPAGVINEFASAPFTGATVANLLPFTNGTDVESDQELRDRMKNHIRSLAKGTKIAILTGVTGLISTTENKRVVSATWVDGADTVEDPPNEVYIDDGTGFEPSFLGRGIETVLGEAAGSEEILNVQHFPLVKASLITDNQQPFTLSGGEVLLVDVDGTTETLNFLASHFLQPGAASAEEVAAAINNQSFLVEARTTGNRTQVILTPRTWQNERLQVLGGDGNLTLQFPENQVIETLRLYQNDFLLQKDGRPARVETTNTLADMDFSVGGPAFTFDVVVDQKTSNPITVTINAADFANPLTPQMDELLAAINDDLVGATATGIFNNTQVRLTSHEQEGSLSFLEVQAGGSALGATLLDFPTTEQAGIVRDYTLNPWNGQIRLETPLVAEDKVEAGSRETRGFLDCVSPEPYTIGAGETLIVDADGGGNATFTFAGGVLTAQQVIDEIEASRFDPANNLHGVGFSVVNRGGQNFLRIRTETWDRIIGSVRVDAASTATALDFSPTDTVVSNIEPNVGFALADNLETYTLGVNQFLVVELDNDAVNRTFAVTMDTDGGVSTSNTDQNFSAVGLVTAFGVDDLFVGWLCRFSDTTATVAIQGEIQTVTAYNGITGAVSVGAAYAAIPQVGDTFEMIPQTAQHVKELLTTPEHTPLGLFADVTIGNQGRALQIASLKNGSAGQVHVLGTTADAFTIPFSGSGTVAGTFQVDSVTGLSVGLPVTLSVLDGNPAPLNATITDITGAAAPFTIEVDGGVPDLSLYTTGETAVVGDQNGLNFDSTVQVGVDGYRSYTGLLQLAQHTIDGLEADLEAFPGLKAAGIRIAVKSPTIQRVTVEVNVTAASGTTLSTIEDTIKSTIASYINGLAVGEDVLVSEIIDRVMDVNGVFDVTVVSPTTNVVIQDFEIARIALENITVG